MSRASRILEGSVDSKLKRELDIILNKVEELSRTHDVWIKTSIKKLRAELHSLIDYMPRDTNPPFQFDSIDGEVIFENHHSFKVAFITHLKVSIKKLKKMKKAHNWIDLKKILTPIIKLEIS